MTITPISPHRSTEEWPPMKVSHSSSCKLYTTSLPVTLREKSFALHFS